MTRNAPLFALTAAALASGLAGVATAATPAQTHAAGRTATRHAAPAAAGRMVTAKTSTGKTVTYDCSKAGNAAKKACK